MCLTSPKGLYGEVEGNSVHVMGLPESNLMLTSSDETTASNSSSDDNIDNVDINEEETGKTNPPSSKTRAVRDTELNDDEEKASEKGDTEKRGDEYDELLEDFNAAFSLTGDDQSGLFTVFLQEPGRTARIQGPGNVEAIRGAVEKVDKFIGQIVSVLANAKLLETGHVIVASTPGYVDVKLTNLITLKDDIEGLEADIIAGHSPVLNIKSEGESNPFLTYCEVSLRLHESHLSNLILPCTHSNVNELQMQSESTRV